MIEAESSWGKGTVDEVLEPESMPKVCCCQEKVLFQLCPRIPTLLLESIFAISTILCRYMCKSIERITCNGGFDVMNERKAVLGAYQCGCKRSDH